MVKWCFLAVGPSKIIFLIEDTISQREDIMLLYIGYQQNTAHVDVSAVINRRVVSDLKSARRSRF